MTEEILEPVDVAAVFGNNQIRPRWFVWKNRRYPVEKITYTWREKEGEEVICYFSVTSSATLYYLAYHTKKLKWVLDRIFLDG